MTLHDVMMNIYSMKLSDLIPLSAIQTEEDKTSQKSGYVIQFTEDEWKAKYPNVPADNIFYAPFLASSTMVYYNAESCAWVNLPIYTNEDGRKNPYEEPDYVSKALQTAEDAAKKGEWGQLIYNMPNAIQMVVLNKLMDRAKDEKEKEKIYGLFKCFYPLINFFTWMLPKDFAPKFMAAKSEAQKEETRKALEHIKGDTVVVYRGAADKSARPENALSWSEDINIAYLFALKAGKCPEIYMGEVNKKDVLEYFEGREKEVTVIPGSVTVKEVKKLYSFDTPEVEEAVKKVTPVFFKARAELAKLYDEKDKKMGKNKGHDREHSLRVLAFSLILGQMEGLSSTQLRKLALAATYHDIGRCDDSSDCSHGEHSAKICKAKKKFRADSSVAFLIRCHCIPDSEAQAIAPSELDKKLLWILKDADALDRFRFGWVGCGDDTLDVTQLRFESSKLFVDLAHHLQRFDF